MHSTVNLLQTLLTVLKYEIFSLENLRAKVSSFGENLYLRFFSKVSDTFFFKMTLQTVLMSSLKRQETSLENVLNRLNTEQQKSEQNEQYVNQQLKVKSQEIDAYKSNVEEQFRAMSGMFNQFMKMASTELDLDIQTTNQKTDHTEYNKLKIELDLSETEAKRLRAENIEINKRLRAFISCQICDEPFDTRKRDFFSCF